MSLGSGICSDGIIARFLNSNLPPRRRRTGQRANKRLCMMKTSRSSFFDPDEWFIIIVRCFAQGRQSFSGLHVDNVDMYCMIGF